MKRSVCFIAPHFYPHLGGVEKHIFEVSLELIKQGWQVTVVTVQDSPDIQLDERFHGIKVVRIPLSAQQNKFSLWQWIRHSNIFNSATTIYHVHDVGWWLMPVLPTVMPRLYCTFHGWEGDYPVRWQAKLHRLVVAKLCRGTMHVGDFIKDFYWDSPSVVTYGGVRLSHAGGIPKPDPLHPKIVFLGRLETENAVEQYITLLTKLRSLGVTPHITWIGDGALRKQCEIWGEVTGTTATVSDYLQPADCVFASSYLAMLESQAAHKLVCAMYQHPLKQRYIETYPGSKWLIHGSDPEQVARQLKDTFNRLDTLKQMVREAADFAHTQTWKNVAELYQELWGI